MHTPRQNALRYRVGVVKSVYGVCRDALCHTASPAARWATPATVHRKSLAVTDWSAFAERHSHTHTCTHSAVCTCAWQHAHGGNMLRSHAPVVMYSFWGARMHRPLKVLTPEPQLRVVYACRVLRACACEYANVCAHASALCHRVRTTLECAINTAEHTRTHTHRRARAHTRMNNTV